MAAAFVILAALALMLAHRTPTNDHQAQANPAAPVASAPQQTSSPPHAGLEAPSATQSPPPPASAATVTAETAAPRPATASGRLSEMGILTREVSLTDDQAKKTKVIPNLRST